MRVAMRYFVVLAAAAVAAPCALAFQATTRVSVDSSGAEGNGRSMFPILSADGRLVVFTSDAYNLVPGDKNVAMDVFLHDLSTGSTECLSVDSAGILGNKTSQAGWYQAISDDGNLVVFFSEASNLVPGDTNGWYDVFVRDRADGTTTRVSVDSAGNEANHLSGDCGISGDGRFVFFGSYASNLVANDTNNRQDIFVHELATGVTERVSVATSGAEGNEDSRAPAISADGRFVAFHTRASSLVAGDTNNAEDIFVRDRQAGTTERVSVDSNGAQANDWTAFPTMSADGRLIAFDGAASNLVAGDTNQVGDAFVHDRATGTTVRVSVDSTGAEGKRSSELARLAADGRSVVFASLASNLAGGDANGVSDVFLHALASGGTFRVSLDATGGEGNGISNLATLSSTGHFVAFHSFASNLVASDTNGFADVFVRSVCGATATWSNYGSGYPGTYGVPSLTAQQFPSFGATITLDLANSYGAPTVGLLLLGLQRASIPTKWGGDLLVLPALIAPISFSFGGNSFTGTIPDDVALCGVAVDLQGIEVDPGAAFGLSFSPGLELLIGN